jgi:serine/threonine protein kinase
MSRHDRDTHPASQVLVGFALGQLEDDEATAVADHLGVCEPCQKAVLAVPDDRLVALLRPAGSTPVPQPGLLGATALAFDDQVPAELRDHARYRILRRLGAGGMGVVYKAEHRLMERPVALKVLSKQLTASAALVERFRREVRAVARLAHPNLVQAYDAEQEGDLHFLVMEFVEGENLAWLVDRNGPLPVDRACDCVRQAALGLAHALTLGLVHRDVKPQNLIVTPQGQVKLLDFGLASIAEERGGGGLTELGQGLGTPDYMAPEQVRDAHSADARSDVYALGCTLYFLLTGRPPFPGGGAAQKMAAHLEKQPEPLGQLRPEVPAGLARVIERMMAKEPALRYQTPGDVVAALEPWCRPLPEAGPPPTQGSATTPKRARFRIAALLVGAAAGLAAVALLAWSWLFPSPGPRLGGTTSGTEDPRVLTVSKRPEDGGRFRTIQEALDEVEPWMTVRVLDDAVYDEYLDICLPDRHRGVILEATGGASLRRERGNRQAVHIRNVSGFTLRGFRFASPPDRGHCQVYIAGRCPGVVLDRLHMSVGNHKDHVNLYEQAGGTRDAPLVIQNCTMQECTGPGISIEGRDRVNPLERPLSCGHVVIRDNTFIECGEGVTMIGAVHKVHVVGNRIVGSRSGAIFLADLVPDTADVLVANNTMLRNFEALRVWDDHSRGQDFLKCKNIRFQNNLVLKPRRERDLVCYNHRRGNFRDDTPGDVASLLKSPQWHFSHNWRELRPLKDDTPGWIPRCANDQLEPAINAGSRKLDDPNFLRPPKGSPLAGAGAGGKDSALPAYVGAVAPEGVEPWDWNRTWKALTGGVRPDDPAPDLSEVMPLIDDDFSDPRTSHFPTHWDPKTGNDLHFETRGLSALLAGNLVGSRSANSLSSLVTVGCAVHPSVSNPSDGTPIDRYVMRMPRPVNCVAMWPNHAVEGDFACEVVGRAQPGGDGWGIKLNPFLDKRDLVIRLQGDRSVDVGALFWERGSFDPIAVPIRHRAIHPLDRFNRLLVVLRGGKWLEIFSSHLFQYLISWSRHAEFTRFRVWLLTPPGPAPVSGEGSRPPDLTKVEPFIDDDFSPAWSRFSRGRDNNGEWYFEKGLYVVRSFPTRTPEEWGTGHNFWGVVGAPSLGDVACQVEGRVLTGGDHGWSVGFAVPGKVWDRSVSVRLRREGAVEVGSFMLAEGPPVTIAGPIRHPKVRPGNKFNTVLAVLRGGRRLEVYVNGSAICAPIQLEQPLSPVLAGIEAWLRSGHYEPKGRAEFRRFTVWRLSR